MLQQLFTHFELQGHSGQEKHYWQKDARNRHNYLNDHFNRQKAAGLLSNFTVNGRFTSDPFEDCVVSWSTFCPNDCATCSNSRVGDRQEITQITERYIVTPERVERYEQAAARVERNAELVTAARSESYVVTPASQRVEVTRAAYTEQVLVTAAMRVEEDLRPLYDLSQGWLMAANAYEAAINVVVD